MQKGKEGDSSSSNIPDRSPGIVILGQRVDRRGMVAATVSAVFINSFASRIAQAASLGEQFRQVESDSADLPAVTSSTYGYVLEEDGDFRIDQEVEAGSDPTFTSVRFSLDYARSAARGASDPNLAMALRFRGAGGYRIVSRQDTTHPTSGPGFLVNLPYAYPHDGVKYPITALEIGFGGMVWIGDRGEVEDPSTPTLYQNLRTYETLRDATTGILTVSYLGRESLERAAVVARDASVKQYFVP